MTNCAPLYLSDLKPELQADIERDIRENRPELVEYLIKDEDIIIGEYYQTEYFVA